MKEAVASAFEEAAERRVEGSLREIRQHPTLGAFGVGVNALGVEYRRKRLRLQIHGAGRENRSTDEPVNHRPLNASISVTPEPRGGS